MYILNACFFILKQLIKNCIFGNMALTESHGRIKHHKVRSLVANSYFKSVPLSR